MPSNKKKKKKCTNSQVHNVKEGDTIIQLPCNNKEIMKRVLLFLAQPTNLPKNEETITLLMKLLSQVLDEVKQDIPDKRVEEIVSYDQLMDPTYEIADTDSEDIKREIEWAKYQSKADLYVELFVDALQHISNGILDSPILYENSDIQTVIIGLVTLATPTTPEDAINFIIEIKHRYIYSRLKVFSSVIKAIIESGSTWWMKNWYGLSEGFACGMTKGQWWIEREKNHTLYIMNFMNIIMTSPPTIYHAEMLRLLSSDSYLPTLFNSINPQLCRDSYPDPAITFISSNNKYWQNRLKYMPPLLFWKYSHLVYKGQTIDRTCLHLLKEPIDPTTHFVCKSTIPDPRLFVNLEHAFGCLDRILTSELILLMQDHCNNKQSPFHTLVKVTRPMVYAIKIPKAPSEIVDTFNEEEKFLYLSKWDHFDSHKKIELNSKCIIVLCQEMSPSLQVEIPNTKIKPRFSSIRTKLEPSAAYYSSIQ